MSSACRLTDIVDVANADKLKNKTVNPIPRTDIFFFLIGFIWMKYFLEKRGAGIPPPGF